MIGGKSRVRDGSGANNDFLLVLISGKSNRVIGAEVATHLGAVRAGLLRVGDELPAVESRVEGFFDGVGQGLLLLTVGAKARSVGWARG